MVYYCVVRTELILQWPLRRVAACLEFRLESALMKVVHVAQEDWLSAFDAAAFRLAVVAPQHSSSAFVATASHLVRVAARNSRPVRAAPV